MTITPRRPSSTPPSRCGVIFSSRVSKCASTTVNSGVVAFRIAARPPVIRVCPQKIRLNGIRLLSAPITKNAAQRAMLAGMRRPVA
jgi:hypothetical protein